jgi:hypothetical protein
VMIKQRVRNWKEDWLRVGQSSRGRGNRQTVAQLRIH